MKGLAEDGHEVTVVSPFKQKQPIKNYNEVFLEHSWEMSRKSKVTIGCTCIIKKPGEILISSHLNYFSNGQR